MLHVLTGPGCNNNCLFCMEADRDGRDAAVRAQTRDDVREMIDAYPLQDEILFTSGEPTLNPDLLEYVGWAKHKGFRVIGLITNGRRLSYPAFLASLLEAGVNRITVSIHGHNAALHDGLTRAPGSFEHTHAALQNLALVKRAWPLRVHTSTVVCQRNLPELAQVHRYLSDGPSDQMVFNIMMAKGRGALHFARMMPRYADVLRAFDSLCSSLDTRALERLKVVDVPACVLQSLPEQVRGGLEVFDQFERVGSTGLTEIAVRNACSEIGVESQRLPTDASGKVIEVAHLDDEWGDVDRPWWNPPWLSRWARRRASEGAEGAGEPAARSEDIETLRARISAAQAGQDGAYYMTRRDLKDSYLRAKGPPCETCALRESCPGVWKVYVDQHGWSEFHPLAASQAEAATPDAAHREK
ncbi:MAG: radical SAM protein [Deltaproteobacteria bacterium]|nr:radical SAM protein [Deltaproteobacteria bacterium]